MKPAPMTPTFFRLSAGRPPGRRAPLFSSCMETNSVRIIAAASGERSILANQRLSTLQGEIHGQLQALVDGVQDGLDGG